MPRPEANLLHCGATQVLLAAFTRGTDRASAGAVTCEPLPEPREGCGTWEERTGAALASLGERMGGGRRRVTLVIPGHLVLAKHVTVPVLSAAKRGKILRFEAAEAIPIPLQEVEWAHLNAAILPDRSVELILAARVSALERLCTASEDAGFDVDDAVPGPIGALSAFRFVKGGSPAAAVFLSVGLRTSAIGIVESRGFLLRNLAPGLDQIRDFETRSAFADTSGAGGLLGSAAAGSDGSADRLRDAVARRLATEVRHSLLHFRRQLDVPEPGIVYVAGLGPGGGELIAALAVCLGLPAVAFDSCDCLGPSCDTGLSMVSVPIPIEVAGAASSVLGLSPSLPSLLPSARRRSVASRCRFSSRIVTGLLLLAALVLPWMRLSGEARILRRLDRAARAALVPLQQWEARMAAANAALADLECERDLLRQKIVDRARWIGLLAGFEKVVEQVREAWLESVGVLGAASQPVELRIAGRMVAERSTPGAFPEEVPEKARLLLAGIRSLAGVQAVSGERFERNEPGILDFAFTVSLRATGGGRP